MGKNKEEKINDPHIDSVRLVHYDKGKKGWNLVIGIENKRIKPKYKKEKKKKLYRTYKLRDLEEDINPILEYSKNKYLKNRKEPKISLGRWKKAFKGEIRKIDSLTKRKAKGYQKKKKLILEQNIDNLWGKGIGKSRISNLFGSSDGAIFNANKELLREAMKSGDEQILNFIAQEENMKKSKVKIRIKHQFTIYSTDGEKIAEGSTGNKTLRQLKKVLSREFPNGQGTIESSSIRNLKGENVKININEGAVGRKNIGRIEVYSILSANKG